MNFYSWLMTQKDRDDPIGDLATDASADTDAPIEANSLEQWRSHIELQGGCFEAAEALESAWEEYQHI